MMLGIWFRAGVSAAETALLAQGWDQLLLRKAANGVGGAIATASLLLMSVVRSPLVAMLAFTGVTLGNSFNQSSVTPNYLEVAGPDSAPHHPRLVSHRCARAAAAVVAPVFRPYLARFFPSFARFHRLDGGAAALPAPRLPLPPCLPHAQRSL